MKKIEQQIANTIRGLSIDAINQANSGHPGLPLGCADIASVLYSQVLQQNPNNPHWVNRDQFVLSAGHGSMLLYAALHLAGYTISLNDIKNFRQLHSPAAGHPEVDLNHGIETTTGPLGQGIGHAVGLALAKKILASTFNTPEYDIFNGTVYALAGDGCLMEGVASEACSFAGHLALDNLVLIYDSNDICLDGPISECFTENVAQRFKSYGWDVITIDGHNYDEIIQAFKQSKSNQKPTLIEAKTTIGYGSPNRAGTAEAHGKALGKDEGQLTKEALGISTDSVFHVPQEVTAFFNDLVKQQQTIENNWNSMFTKWKEAHPDLHAIYEQSKQTSIPVNLIKQLKESPIKSGLASRASSKAMIQLVHELLPSFIGGSADLSCSDSTAIGNSGIISKNDFTQRNIKYGVREFAMGAISAGLSLSGFFRPLCATFFTFSDYMKNAIRLTAYMKLPVIYQFTHDSIFLGEDGPTHQSIEHLASLRSMPNLTVIRPADSNEVRGAWIAALTQNETPTALVLSRQGLPEIETSNIDKVQYGAYIIYKEKDEHIDYAIYSTGAEVSLAIDVAKTLENEGKSVRVVSMPSFELFDAQENDYKNTILAKTAKFHVAIEAQTSFGWHKYVGSDGICITMEDYGLSAPATDLADYFGFTVEKIISKIRETVPVSA
ncbi:transketolase [Candidatus Marinamargulisbacteria bacterium SCGC AG-414-C22]|nr:transketolase [Candidatus Marinamargulisbacteria bacterium SCGC AG-414-C22]